MWVVYVWWHYNGHVSLLISIIPTQACHCTHSHQSRPNVNWSPIMCTMCTCAFINSKWAKYSWVIIALNPHSQKPSQQLIYCTSCLSQISYLKSHRYWVHSINFCALLLSLTIVLLRFILFCRVLPCHSILWPNSTCYIVWQKFCLVWWNIPVHLFIWSDKDRALVLYMNCGGWNKYGGDSCVWMLGP